MELIDTAGAANANTYSSLAFARSFHESRVHNSDWFEKFTQEQLAAALIEATRRIDLYNYKGQPTTRTQFLKFPRQNMYVDGGYADRLTVPVQVQYATAQLALDYLRKDVGARSAQATASVSGQIQSFKAGSFQINYGGSGATVTQDSSESFLSKESRLLLLPFLGKTYSGNSLVRV